MTFSAYGRRLKSQRALTRCDLRIASPTHPYNCGVLNSPNRNPRAAIAELVPPMRPQVAKIAGHKATKIRGCGGTFFQLFGGFGFEGA